MKIQFAAAGGPKQIPYFYGLIFVAIRPSMKEDENFFQQLQNKRIHNEKPILVF